MTALLIEIGVNPTVLDVFGKMSYDYVKGHPKLMNHSKYAQHNRKIHDDPLSIEYNKLPMHGIDPEQADSLSMNEFTRLKEEKPTRPRHTDQEAIQTCLIILLKNQLVWCKIAQLKMYYSVLAISIIVTTNLQAF